MWTGGISKGSDLYISDELKVKTFLLLFNLFVLEAVFTNQKLNGL